MVSLSDFDWILSKQSSFFDESYRIYTVLRTMEAIGPDGIQIGHPQSFPGKPLHSQSCRTPEICNSLTMHELFFGSLLYWLL